MKKKLLILMPAMFIGGAERSLLGLLNELDYEKVEVYLFLFRHEGEFLPYVSEKVTILPEMSEYRTFDVPVKSLFNRKQWRFALARTYAKICQKKRRMSRPEKYGTWMSMQMISKSLLPLLPKVPGSYDAAISFLGIPDVLAYKTDAKIKMAWNHTDYTTLGPDKTYDNKVFQSINYIVSVSDKCTEQFLKVYPGLRNKAITIENVLSPLLIDEQALEECNDMKVARDEICLLSIGRFCHAKNFDNIPEICQELLKNGLQVKWFIIGYGDEEQLVREKIRSFHMEEYVVILGKKQNPYPYIKKCDFYIQPSRYEGKAVTVREAQLLHKPVIITKFATSSKQLDDGVDGIIVPMDNIGCAEGIAKVIRDTDLSKKLVSNTKNSDYTNRSEIEKLYSIIGV